MNTMLYKKLVDLAVEMKLADAPPYEEWPIKVARGDVQQMLHALALVEAINDVVKK